MAEDFSGPGGPFAQVGAGSLPLGGRAPLPPEGVPGSELGAPASLRPLAGGAWWAAMRKVLGWEARLALRAKLGSQVQGRSGFTPKSLTFTSRWR